MKKILLLYLKNKKKNYKDIIRSIGTFIFYLQHASFVK